MQRTAIVVWVVLSLLAISISGDNILLALLIALAGGIAMGAILFFGQRS